MLLEYRYCHHPNRCSAAASTGPGSREETSLDQSEVSTGVT